MKKGSLTIVLPFLIIGCILLLQCENPSGTDEKRYTDAELVGTWEGEYTASWTGIDMSHNVHFELKSDKTVNFSVNMTSLTLYEADGVWEIRADKLHITSDSCKSFDTTAFELKTAPCVTLDDIPVTLTKDTATGSTVWPSTLRLPTGLTKELVFKKL